MYKRIIYLTIAIFLASYLVFDVQPSFAGTDAGLFHVAMGPQQSQMQPALNPARQQPQQQAQPEQTPTQQPFVQPTPQPTPPPVVQPKPQAPAVQPAPAQQPPAQTAPVQQPPQPQQPRPAAQPPAQPAQATPPPPPQPQTLQPPAHPARRGDVSFNFDDADVYSVIQTVFGDILRVNYIVDPSVKGRVTFRSVEPISKEDVLPLMEVILRLNGIGIVEEGGLYRIIPIADISKEPTPVGMGRNPGEVKITGKAMVQIVPIHYVQSSEVVRVLTPFLSKNAVIVDVPKSNYIVIVDTDSNVRRLLELVNTFDSEELKQVTPRVFVYPVQNGKAKDVANLLQQIFLGAKPSTTTTPAKPVTAAAKPVPGQPIPQQAHVITGESGAPGAVVSDVTKIIPDEVTNSIIILATPEDYQLIYDTIEKVDIQQRQVVIEALIVQVDLKDNLSFGLSWSLNTDLKISGLKPFKKDINLPNSTATQAPGGLNITATPSPIPASGFSFIGLDPTGNVRAVLTALEDRSRAKVVAAPHVLVSDNKEARIQIGQQIPLATSTSSSVGTTATTSTTGETVVTPVIGTSTIQYKDIGIILKVKPQVNDSGLISLEFSQEISSVGSSVQVGGLNEVSINKTEASSNLVAQDGETIIIGGLIREDTTHGRQGIPLLSRIPILGALFGNTSDANTRQEIIILLTPHVVRNEKEAQGVTSDYVKRYKGVTHDEAIDKFIHQEEQLKGEDEENQGKKPQGEKPQENQGGNAAPSVSPMQQ